MTVRLVFGAHLNRAGVGWFRQTTGPLAFAKASGKTMLVDLSPHSLS